MDAYESWYGLDGIFLDESASSEDQIPYYRALSRHIRSAGKRLVVANPGVVPADGYFELADTVVTFEGSYGAYAGALERMPAWVGRLPQGRTAHLVYGASREQALEAVSRESGAASVYVTSGSLPNPWGELPSYLEETEEQLLESCS